MNDFPQWGTWLWRAVRTAVATAIAQTVATKVDWTNFDSAWRTVAVSFVAAFLVALSLAVRDLLAPDNPGAMVQKLPI